MTIARLRVGLSGPGIVGAGLMTFYTRNLAASGFPGQVKSFLTAVQPALAGGVIMDVPNGGDTMNEETGDLVSTWSGTGGGQVTAPTTGTYTLGAGGRIEWRSGQIFAGHHPRGRTFLVPFISGAFDSSGRIGASTVTMLQSAANALISAAGGDMVLWCRPRTNYVGKKGPLPDRLGGLVTVSSALVPTTPTSLRSRRY